MLYRSSLRTPFRNCFAVGLLWGVALFNPILTGYKSTPRLSIGKRARTACQSSERVPHQPAALKQCSVPCPCCLASQSERALRLRSVACQGTPFMLCRASRPRPHGTKCCLMGKYATKTGIWAMKRIKSRRKMGTNEREINLGRARKESERHD